MQIKANNLCDGITGITHRVCVYETGKSPSPTEKCKNNSQNLFFAFRFFLLVLFCWHFQTDQEALRKLKVI